MSEGRYSPVAVANAFLKRAQEDGEPLSPMKILKLVYYAYGWHLALNEGEKLFEEGIEAWKHGPVVASLWGRLQDEEGNVVRSPIDHFEDIDPEDRFTEDLIDEVWDAYGDFRAIKLSNLTHMPGTPWYQVKEENGGSLPRRQKIEDEKIKKYFEDLLKESE